MATLEQLPLKAWQELLARVPAGSRVLAWLVHLDGFIRNIVERDPFTFTNGGRVVQTNASTTYLEESSITTTELNYLSGASSNIQGQLNTKYDKTGGPISGEVTFTGTGRLTWTKVAANGVTLTDITSSDTVSGLQTAFDGSTYTADEAAASAGQNLVVDFTGVTAFSWVRILARYQGSSAHALSIQMEITPFDGSTWHTYGGIEDQPADYSMENYSFMVVDDTPYINSGVVKIRFIHPSGNVGHEWVFDEVALYQ